MSSATELVGLLPKSTTRMPSSTRSGEPAELIDGQGLCAVSVGNIREMNWACLAVGVLAAVGALSALVPLRGAVGSALSFIPSWVLGEAPLHLAVLVIAAILACGLSGGFASALGLAGTALGVLGCAGLVAQFVSGVRSKQHFESALSEAGLSVPPWSWSATDTRRVVVALPLRPLQSSAPAISPIWPMRGVPTASTYTAGALPPKRRARRQCSCTSTAAPG